MPTQETRQSEGSVCIGSASICAPTSSIFIVSPYLVHPSPINLSLLSLPLSVCIASFTGSPSPPLPGVCLPSGFLCILAPSWPSRLRSSPLHPSVSTRRRVIHLHWGDTCAVLTVRALTEWEEGKQQPHDSKDTLSVGKHIRPSITEAHPTPPTVRVLTLVTAVRLNDPAPLERCSRNLCTYLTISQHHGFDWVWYEKLRS